MRVLGIAALLYVLIRWGVPLGLMLYAGLMVS